MTLILILLTAALVVAVAMLAATAAGILARAEGATVPAVLTRAAAVFGTVLTLACLITTTVVAVTR